MSSNAADPSIGDMTEWEAREFLGRRGTGSIAILAGQYPIALPIIYEYTEVDGHIGLLIRTREASELSRAIGPASMLVDEIDVGRGRATSVLARGELCNAPDSILSVQAHPWVNYPRSVTLILRVERVSGRRFAVTGTDDEYHVDWGLTAHATDG